jgi:hypothetical protein
MDQLLVGLICIVIAPAIVVAYEMFCFLRQGQLFFREARRRFELAQVCTKCGREILVSGAKFCGKCGGQLVKAA